jgi:hypothetical protein
MKLVSVLGACLVVVAESRFDRQLNLSDRIKMKMAGPDGIAAVQADKRSRREQYEQYQRETELRTIERKDEVPGVVKMGEVTPQNEATANKQHAVNQLTSRHPELSSAAITMAAAQTTDGWQLWSLLNTYFVDAMAMIDLNKYNDLAIQKAIIGDVGSSPSVISRAAIALSTGAPSIKYVKERLKPVSTSSETEELTELTNTYTGFMQQCEESFTYVFQKLYGIFYLNQQAANDIGMPDQFQRYSKDDQTYLLEEATLKVNTSLTYINGILELTDTMRNESMRLRGVFQKLHINKQKEKANKECV